MCDYSLMHVQSRPASVGDKLVTKPFGTGTTGFMGADGPDNVAVCVLPGTELAFENAIAHMGTQQCEHKTAIFRQVNKDQPHMHHDCLELPDGAQILLNYLTAGQTATVLQLPAAPRNEAEVEEQRRAEVVG